MCVGCARREAKVDPKAFGPPAARIRLPHPNKEDWREGKPDVRCLSHIQGKLK